MSKNTKNTAPKSAIKDDGESPFEAFHPEVTELQSGDALVRACDGEQVYAYLIVKAKSGKSFRATEVYPGLAKKRTLVREVDDASELSLPGRYASVSEAVSAIDENLFADFASDEDEEVTDESEQAEPAAQ